MISIVIPVYNEKNIIKNTLTQFNNYCGDFEVIVVNAGSTDGTDTILISLMSEVKFRFRYFNLGKNTRSGSINAGANEANGDIFLFLHADAKIDESVICDIQKLVNNSMIVGGALRIKFNSKKIKYRFVEWFSNTRARFSRMYHGDQGIFVRREVFKKMKGFRKIPLMEDVAFSMDLRKYGDTKLLKNSITVSVRRFEANGLWKMIFVYFYLKTLFYLGMDIDYIARVYGRLKKE